MLNPNSTKHVKEMTQEEILADDHPIYLEGLVNKVMWLPIFGVDEMLGNYPPSRNRACLNVALKRLIQQGKVSGNFHENMFTIANSDNIL